MYTIMIIIINIYKYFLLNLFNNNYNKNNYI